MSASVVIRERKVKRTVSFCLNALKHFDNAECPIERIPKQHWYKPVNPLVKKVA